MLKLWMGFWLHACIFYFIWLWQVPVETSRITLHSSTSASRTTRTNQIGNALCCHTDECPAQHATHEMAHDADALDVQLIQQTPLTVTIGIDGQDSFRRDGMMTDNTTDNRS